MTRYVVSILVAITALCGCAAISTVQEAFRYGAEAKLIFKVVDEDGTPVSNANAGVGFYMPVKMEDMPGVTGKTDENGCFVAKEKTAQDVHYCFNKSGYYKSNGDIFMKKLCPEKPIVKGKWQPYGAEVKVVLKKKKNPIPMFVKEPLYQTKPPGLGRTGMFKSGYDLKEFDWVAPFGKGKTTDVVLTLIKERNLKNPSPISFKRVIKMEFPNKGDGLYRKKKDMFSRFVSDYHANTNAVFQSSICFVYDSLSGSITEDTRLKEDEYLVLRTRSQVDKDGNLVSAHYSKIYGEMRINIDGLRWTTYFNSTPNDTNIECDPKKSFYPGRYRPSCP